MNTYIESLLSEELDDLLVADKIERPRQTRISGSTPNGMGMLIMVKEKPRVDFKIEVYPNETEEPHFKIIYQNKTCRFKISDCTPMKAELKNGIPSPIQKIMKQIKKIWSENKDVIEKAWENTRPSDQNHGHQRVK